MNWIRSACAAAAFTGLAIPLAEAHSWYPVDCCSGMDCAPVDRSELLQPSSLHTIPGFDALPVLWVETKHGKAIVPSSMIPRESKDEKVHACIRDKKVICIFMPPIN